jgi:hypothetical protein
MNNILTIKMNNLVLELFELILNECNFNDLFRFGLVSKQYLHITKNITYYKKLVKPESYNNLMYLLYNYKIKMFDLTGFKIPYESVKLLGTCHTLYLFHTKITDESVRVLGACHTLDLSYTNITDESVKFLGECHTLNLRCTKITDESVKFLGACHTLYLFGTKITDESVKWLISQGCNVYK